MAVTRIEEGGLGTDSFNLPVTLNGTDGSSTDAGDNIVLDASASGVDAGERLLYEGIPPDSIDISNSISVLSGATLTIDSGATIVNSGTATGFGATISNDANNRVITADGSEGLNGEANLTFDGSTLTVTGALDVTTDITGLTLNADGDTSAGDNAAIGYTAGEGLILTGQGSTDDITIKNDADTTVVNVATGGTDVEISAGNLLFGTGSKGVYLGVTSATAANLLADYEEGTWTPALTFGGGATGISYNSQLGVYVKVGKMVHCGFYLRTTSNGSSTGATNLTGLPFTVSNTSNAAYGSSLVTNYRSGFSSDHYPGGYASKNGTHIVLVNLDPDSTETSGLTDSDWTDSGLLYGSITYRSES